MNVIVIESDAFQKIMQRLENIENHVLCSNDIYKQVNDGSIEMTSREMMETLKVSESTLYRWRQDKLIAFRYTEAGSIWFPFDAIYRAVYTGNITVRSVEKEELLAMDFPKDEKEILTCPKCKKQTVNLFEKVAKCSN